jgi:hypothetical protein
MMSIGIRKLLVVGTILAVLVLANVGTIVTWLTNSGLIPWAQHVRDEYLNGTAIAVIVALLILLPSRVVWAVLVRRCPVCDAVVLRRGRYCPACGSRV